MTERSKMSHTLRCPTYSNYQPPYEECTCGADNLEAITLAEANAEKLMTVAEIWAAGFQAGQATAGLSSQAGLAYTKWLLERAEKRGLI